MLRVPLSSETLCNTIEALHVLYLRLEIEAAALAALKSPAAKRLAQKRLKDAETAKKLFNYYISI